ncbi:MAG: aminotransferase class I/II-fold pyridoxal phosphate-dependent enzyme, partial [Clostridia bacterium]|nr:aminotransferase class I/II-fold pyridoxal phosphate-dependent enzyme [Clostridia bacterium]
VQEAAAEALTGDLSHLRTLLQTYRERRDILIDGLNSMGWKLSRPLGTFYVWAPVPSGYTSAGFVEEVLEKTGVVLTPGNGYGNCGEGYFRMSLTLATDKIVEAVKRMKTAFDRFHFD